MFVDSEDAFDGIHAGATVIANNCCGTPLTLLGALAEHAERAAPIELRAGLLLGDPPLEHAIRAGALRVRSWHIHGPLRRLAREGLVDYIPVRLSAVPGAVIAGVDVALLRVGPPDADGFCSLGPSTTFAQAAIDAAGLVIAEVADDVPRTNGDSRVHVSQLDRLVRSEHAMPVHPSADPDAVSRAVARHVLSVIPARATVQLGIGAVPEALAEDLVPRVAELSLGLIGLISEPMVPLVEAIAATGRGPVQAVELMGGPSLMAWADGNGAIEMRSSAQVHDPVALSALTALVSVNGAVAVDLRGQVVSESVKGAVIAGVGGGPDFAEGAYLSERGLRVIALRSTAKDGSSCIVARHDPRDAIAAPHHAVDVVVTEHGVAHLRGRTVRERAEALRAIAAPEHREQLAAASADRD
ncbi:acetyl-CoA hydrolase/transferase family protein [Microbacterium immunditiarum]|uniref:Acyl-CoA hydrolase n=1 Tax=Microbacterium immunditiarum TaxID=337480 RepID=A0A7Y9KIN5_9MICO|nr:acetyl-CoA hydrolase/transferase C-terminal domain-containing protein [Microbacterium immunditiarum]NYE18801.1 acyl-CoA hydrolase [Microbacterium immunditiarum]